MMSHQSKLELFTRLSPSQSFFPIGDSFAVSDACTASVGGVISGAQSLSGVIVISVDKVAGNAEFIQAATAACGVRGTALYTVSIEVCSFDQKRYFLINIIQSNHRFGVFELV
jgi:hypothetical protein